MTALTIVSRAQWGAKDWAGTVHRVSFAERTEFFVHYHGGEPTVARGPQVARNVEAIHLKNGWAGPGYNFMVDQDGTIYEGRGWDLVGAHCPNHNRSGIGVYVAVGGKQDATPAALASVRWLYDEAVRRRSVALLMRGHRDGKATACPGDKLYAWVRAGMVVNLAVAIDAVVHGRPVPAVFIVPQTDDRPILRRGSRGRHVTAVQKRLLELGYQLPRFGADGDFGEETAAAVRLLQATAGCIVDGVIGTQTYAALDKGVRAPAVTPATPPASAAAPAAPKPTAKPRPAPTPPYPGATHHGDGRRGRPHAPTVEFQKRLRARGWKIDVDGIHRAGTTSVLRAYQTEKRLTVDGIGGRQTWESLWTAPIT